MKDSCIQYGHVHLGFLFVPLFETCTTGLVYRGREYPWAQVRIVAETAPGMVLAVGYPFGKPKATIELAGETKITIDGRSFCKRGERAKVGFFSSTSDAFTDFVKVLRAYQAG